MTPQIGTIEHLRISVLLDRIVRQRQAYEDARTDAGRDARLARRNAALAEIFHLQGDVQSRNLHVGLCFSARDRAATARRSVAIARRAVAIAKVRRLSAASDPRFAE